LLKVTRNDGRNRVISALLAAFYGLAVTVSGLLHDHSDSCGGRGLLSATAHDSHPDGFHDDHSTRCGVPGQPSAPPLCPSGERHCVACHFLAQKSLPAGQIIEESPAELVEDLVTAGPPCLFARLSPSWQSRAPPDDA